jgi:hypothetical protein
MSAFLERFERLSRRLAAGKGTAAAARPHMRHRRYWLRAVGVAAVVVLAFSWTSSACAPNCPGCRTTSLLLPLSGTVFYPPGPVFPGENVALAGDVHVVTNVGLNFVTEVHLNMAGVAGVGQTTGNIYIGTGSNKVMGVQLVPNQFPPSPVRTNFTLEPTNGLVSVPFHLAFELVPNSDGTLLPSSTVQVTSDD